MQVNPNIKYNEEDAGLTLDNPIAESTEQVESNDTQDEADLVSVEIEQKQVADDKSQRFLFLTKFIQSRKDDRLFAASCMAAGVISVVVVYFLAVFM